MDEKEKLIESLKGYKEKVPITETATLEWDKDLIFVGRTQRGYEIEFDANLQWGCKPTDALVLALAGCTAIDVFVFLQKMQAEIKNFKISINAERNPTPPQYYKAIHMTITVKGQNIDSRKIERAISLSHEKYCSVYHSLRKDMDVKINYEIIKE
ncbi:MAG: OsmC family protein [Thermodesulfovibrionales bacterium]|nr:OsmC family protein [Thermodesulfovibrionales bacterium]